MLGSDLLAAVDIGDRPRNLQDAVVRSGRQAEAVHGGLHEGRTGFVDLAVLADMARLHLGIGVDAVVREPSLLDGAGAGHAVADRRRRLAKRIGGDLVELDGRYFDVDVDAVHERARDFGTVGLDLVRRAEALMERIAVEPALAGVHGRHQHQRRRIGERCDCARDRDLAILQRLAQRFEHIAFELGQFVQEQHPVVDS